VVDVQFKIASKVRESTTRVIDLSIKNLLRSYVSKIFLVVYAINCIRLQKSSNFFGVGKTYHEMPIDAVRLALKINYRFLKNYKPKSSKRACMMMPDSSKRTLLCVLTISDRIIQKMFQLIIDPVADVFADPDSYGFRNRRSCHHAIGALANRLTKATGKTVVLQLDVENFFDSVDYN
jgi:RNA-directed DNA polymerase